MQTIVSFSTFFNLEQNGDQRLSCSESRAPVWSRYRRLLICRTHSFFFFFFCKEKGNLLPARSFISTIVESFTRRIKLRRFVSSFFPSTNRNESTYVLLQWNLTILFKLEQDYLFNFKWLINSERSGTPGYVGFVSSVQLVSRKRKQRALHRQFL